MSDLQTVRARIADRINRSDLNTQIDKEINRAIQHYANTKRFWFNETTGTFATVSGQIAYSSSDSIPTYITEIDLVKIALSSTNSIELRPVQYVDLQKSVFNPNATGSPEVYAYYKENFYIYPIPGAVYTVTVHYAKSYADLTAAQSNDFTSNAEDLIEARAGKIICAGLVHNSDLAIAYSSMEIEALAALSARTERLTGTGEVKPTVY